MESKPIIITEKIGIGISACCFGCPVRYNGKGFDVLSNLGRDKSDFRWFPVCPESMAGLGVPRDSIHVSGKDGKSVWTGEASVKQRNGRDVTDALCSGCDACMQTLKLAGVTAYIYMDGSPTCGVYRTSLKKQKRGNPPGVFGSLLLDNMYFLIPSTDVQSPLKWWDWKRRLLVFYWLQNASLKTKSELYEVWHIIKFIMQELDNKNARKTGRVLADMKGSYNSREAELMRMEWLDILRKPSNPAKIKNSLWKHYSFYRKRIGKTIPEINSPEFLRNITTVAAELSIMERASVDDGILFGASPVIYRDRRRIQIDNNELQDES